MVLSSISSPGYFSPQAQAVPHLLSQHVQYGAGLNPAGSSPIPGSNWAADKAVWVAQGSEVSFLDRAHVSEVAGRMISRSAGTWEIQSHSLRLLQATQNSLERSALAAGMRTRSAINGLLTFQASLAGTGVSVDVYA
ncbi:MAG: hypothetical protein FVQ81_07010 [Candidatus Glassbacteria bacterium]|nr:hypothetical protein [Candidatus Glassbacteria bacterium]